MNTLGAFRCFGVWDHSEPVWCVTWGYFPAMSRDSSSSSQGTIAALHDVPTPPILHPAVPLDRTASYCL